MASLAYPTFLTARATTVSLCDLQHSAQGTNVVSKTTRPPVIRQKPSNQQRVLGDRHYTQIGNRASLDTSISQVEKSTLTADRQIDGRSKHSTDYPGEIKRNHLRVPVPLKEWLQEQKETVELVGRQILSAYQLAVTDIVDHLFVPSEEPVSFIQGNFAPVPEIGEKVQIQVVEGKVPEDFPPGCFLRNGPNPRFGAHQNLDSPLFGGKTLYSWFEGEGMLHATYFEEDGSIWYKNKYVETDSFKLETELGRTMYLPSMDEQSSPGLRFNRLINMIRFGKPQRNPGNTSIFEHAGHVVAAAEGAKAYEIDISDLSTKGEYNCNGQWHRRFFGPHPKAHPDTNQMVVYGFDIIKPYCVLGVLSADGEKFSKKIDLGMERLVLMHDIGLTEGHIIVYDFPIVIDLASMLLKGESIVNVDPTTYSRIGVIPITGDSEAVKWFDVDSACISHHCNSFQEGDEIVVHGLITRLIQMVAIPRNFDKLEWYSRGMTLDDQNDFETKDPSIDGLLYEHLHEWRLNLKTGQVVERDISQHRFPLECPKINDALTGKKYQFFYACSEDIEASKSVGFPKFKYLVKGDVSAKSDQLAQFHDVGEKTFVSEPVFVPRPGSVKEDDGWLVAYVHNELTNISDVIIIDAQKFDKEPVARLRLPQRVPYGFHGTYVPYK